MYFSPIPGMERVIAVALWTSFVNKPTVDAVLQGARSRYTLPATLASSKQQADGVESYLSWRFDRNGRLMSEGAAKAAGMSFAGAPSGASLPGEVSVNRGEGLDFYVRSTTNPKIAQSYSITLFNENGLFNFTEQANAIQTKIDQQLNDNSIDKAKQNKVVIK